MFLVRQGYYFNMPAIQSFQVCRGVVPCNILAAFFKREYVFYPFNFLDIHLCAIWDFLLGQMIFLQQKKVENIIAYTHEYFFI